MVECLIHKGSCPKKSYAFLAEISGIGRGGGAKPFFVKNVSFFERLP